MAKRKNDVSKDREALRRAEEKADTYRFQHERAANELFTAEHLLASEKGTREGRKARHHPAFDPFARITIEEVYPELEAGRYPVKRIEGDLFEVWADIFRDGHEKIAAAVSYRHEEGPWREAAFAYFDNDRWVARFRLDRIGLWRYAIEAWTLPYESWCEEVEKKRAAGQDLAVELIEGRALVAMAEESAPAADGTQLSGILRAFDERTEEERADLLLSPAVRELMERALPREDPVRYPKALEVVVDRECARFAAWYEMFPRSQGKIPGKSASFEDCVARLPEIAALGFDVVYLVPIHPIGRANRKGPNNTPLGRPEDPGSPYAIGAAEGGHCAIHPELGTLAEFRHLVEAASELGIEIALDFAIQCAPDHPWIQEHPEWFRFRPDGTVKYAENPPKKYEDIVNVEFYNSDWVGLWRELRDVVLFWVEQGVKIFRVDNPHTKPLPFWEWLIREVKAAAPETIFLSEAFTRPKRMRALAKAGFSLSYTYFTWRTAKDELIEYLTELTQSWMKEYFRPNFFTNTPDILSPFLQSGGRPAFRIRLVLAATLSPVYGIYNGFELCENVALPESEEYANSEKYQYKVWDWDRAGNIKEEIRIVNRFRRENAALQQFFDLRFLPCENPNVIAYAKRSLDGANIVVAVVSLDPHRPQEGAATLPLGEFSLPEDREYFLEEAFSGRAYALRGSHLHFALDPNENPALLFRLAPA